MGCWVILFFQTLYVLTGLKFVKQKETLDPLWLNVIPDHITSWFHWDLQSADLIKFSLFIFPFFSSIFFFIHKFQGSLLP